jgi:hypothetical protein
VVIPIQTPSVFCPVSEFEDGVNLITVSVENICRIEKESNRNEIGKITGFETNNTLHFIYMLIR